MRGEGGHSRAPGGLSLQLSTLLVTLLADRRAFRAHADVGTCARVPLAGALNVILTPALAGAELLRGLPLLSLGPPLAWLEAVPLLRFHVAKKSGRRVASGITGVSFGRGAVAPTMKLHVCSLHLTEPRSLSNLSGIIRRRLLSKEVKRRGLVLEPKIAVLNDGVLLLELLHRQAVDIVKTNGYLFLWRHQEATGQPGKAAVFVRRGCCAEQADVRRRGRGRREGGAIDRRKPGAGARSIHERLAQRERWTQVLWCYRSRGSSHVSTCQTKNFLRLRRGRSPRG